MTATDAVAALEAHFACALTDDHRGDPDQQHRTRYVAWFEAIGAARRTAIIAALPSAFPPPQRWLPTIAGLDRLAQE